MARAVGGAVRAGRVIRNLSFGFAQACHQCSEAGAPEEDDDGC